MRQPLALNLNGISYWEPCPYLDQARISNRGGAGSRKAGFLVPLGTESHSYTAIVSPDVTLVQVQGTKIAVKPINGIATFEAAGKPGKAVNIALSCTGPAEAATLQLVRTEWLDNHKRGEIFTPATVRFLTGFSTLRFMDWCRTNDSQAQVWTPVDAPTYTGVAQPIEHMALLCNLTHSHAQINIPAPMPLPEAARAVAQFRSLLDPALKLHVEWSNEVWNTGFAIGKTASSTKDPHGFYAQKSAALQKALAGVPAVKLILCWQWVSPTGMEKVIAAFKAAGGDMGGVSMIMCAPYVSLQGKDAAGKAIDWKTRTDTDLLTASAGKATTDSARFIPAWAALAKANGVEFGLYEVNGEIGPGRGDPASELPRRAAIAQSPAFAEVLFERLRAFDDAGCAVSCLFASVGHVKVYGLADDYDDYVGDPRLQMARAWNAAAAPLTIEDRFAAIEQRLTAGGL